MKAMLIWITWHIFQGAQKQKEKASNFKSNLIASIAFPTVRECLRFSAYLCLRLNTELKSLFARYSYSYTISRSLYISMWCIVLQHKPFGKKKWAIILISLCSKLSKPFIFRDFPIAKSCK